MLERIQDTDWVIFGGWMVAVGMRDCADMAEQARAHRDDDAVAAALAAADNLASGVKREHDVPFTEHPFVAIIPASRATWDAERSRAAGGSDRAAWSAAADQ